MLVPDRFFWWVAPLTPLGREFMVRFGRMRREGPVSSRRVCCGPGEHAGPDGKVLCAAADYSVSAMV